MQRVVLLLGIGCVIASCAAGMWLVSQPPIPLSFPRDAGQLQMAANGWWDWTVSHRTPDPSYRWYSTIVDQLEVDGWMESGERYVGGPPHDPAIYTRMTSLGFVVIWERVELNGDVHGAHLRIYRWLAMASSRYQRSQAIFWSGIEGSPIW